jgi:hypothetical protein
MYSVDSRDEVIKLNDVPRSDSGSPLPSVLSDEHTLLLAYILSEPSIDWDQVGVNFMPPPERVGIIDFKGHRSFMFGSPNDEAFSGHPLAGRGLRPYSAFEIKHSSWIRQLEQMNSVHDRHDKKRYDDLKHYVFSFHDSTFECVAMGYTFEVRELSGNETVVELLAKRMRPE